MKLRMLTFKPSPEMQALIEAVVSYRRKVCDELLHPYLRIIREPCSEAHEFSERDFCSVCGWGRAELENRGTKGEHELDEKGGER